MKLIVGLGNPGNKYKSTRHNVGFMVVDKLAQELDLNMHHDKKAHADTWLSDDIILMQPQTFMNNSGLAVKAIIKKHNINIKDIIVIFDDIDMEIGKIRFRDQGSSGGHKGMQSIMDYLKTEEIPRLKIGIGRSPITEPNKYVTSNFSTKQLVEIKKALSQTTEVIKEKLDIS